MQSSGEGLFHRKTPGFFFDCVCIIPALENFIISKSFDFFWKILYLIFGDEGEGNHCSTDFIMIDCNVLSLMMLNVRKETQ